MRKVPAVTAASNTNLPEQAKTLAKSGRYIVPGAIADMANLPAVLDKVTEEPDADGMINSLLGPQFGHKTFVLDFQRCIQYAGEMIGPGRKVKLLNNVLRVSSSTIGS